MSKREGFIDILAIVLISAIVAGGVSVAGLLFKKNQLENQNQPLGADNTIPIAGATYYLSGSGVSGSATSITLTSLTVPQSGYELVDSDFSDTFYLTLEPANRTRQEIVSCTTVAQSGSDNTATLSGCTRGLLPFAPYTASSTYQFAHAGGSSVVFSNPPQLYNQFTGKNNDEFVTGTWTYASSAIPRLSAQGVWGSGTEEYLVSKRYVDAVATSGAPDASLTQKGIVELATLDEFYNGSSSGGTSATLVPQNSFFNATSSATSTGVVTMGNGKISPSFISTSSNYIWTGAVTSTGAVSFTGETNFTSQGDNFDVGITSQARGDLLYATNTTAWTRLASSTSGGFLRASSTSGVPYVWDGLSIAGNSSSTNFSTPQIFVTTTIAGGVLSTNGGIRIKAAVQSNNGGDAYSFAVRYGGTIVASSSVTANTRSYIEVELMNYNNNTSKQYATWMFSAAAGPVITISDSDAIASVPVLDSTQNQTLSLSIEGTINNLAKVYWWTVEPL